MDSEYVFEAFDESHYSKFNKLYENAFGKKMPITEFKKRFDTQALGFKFVGYLALLRNTGEAVSFYGVFPLKIRIGESDFAAAISGDTMTHKNHRRKGLFRGLAGMTYQKCRELGFVMIYGFPNQQSYHGFVHSLDWKHVNDLIEWNLSFRFKISPLHKFLKRANYLFPLFNSYAHRVLKKYMVSDINSFDNSNGDKYGIVSRNDHYIHYKQSKERIFIKIESVIVWIRLSDVLWIGDFSDLGQVNKIVVSKLKHIAKLLGYNTIRYAINKEIAIPESMLDFKPGVNIPTCILFLEKKFGYQSFLFTPADFDTW